MVEHIWHPIAYKHVLPAPLQEATPLFAAAGAEYCSVGFDSFDVQLARSSGCLQVGGRGQA